MKKWLLGAVIVLVVSLIGVVAVQNFVLADDSTETVEESAGWLRVRRARRIRAFVREARERMMEEDPYEFYYLRLSDEHQDTIDRMYAERLATHDLDALTDEEQLTLIANIKAELVDHMLDEEWVGTWRESFRE